MSETNEEVAYTERDIFRLLQTKSPGDELHLWDPNKIVILVRKGKKAIRVRDVDSEETYKLEFKNIAVKKI